MKPHELAFQQGLEILDPTPAQLERGLELHRSLTVCEGYGFLPKVLTPELKESIGHLNERELAWPEWKRKARVRRVTGPARDAQGAREFFDVIRHSGVDCLVQSVNYMGDSIDDAVPILAAYRHLCNTFKDHLLQATCVEDIDRAKAAGQTAVFYSLTGLPTAGAGSMADPDGMLDWVDVWYHLGVRFMHLGYNRRSLFADGCLEANDGGLSDLGRELVLRMHRVGMVVDIPHSSRKTTFDVAAIAQKPVLISHAGCTAINDHRRCKTDEELKAIAGTGGYVGILATSGFLGHQRDLNTLLRHLEHAIKVIGPEHVTVGTDVGYGQAWPKELPAPRSRLAINPLGRNPDAPATPSAPPSEAAQASLAWSNWPLITVGLVKLGLSDDAIAQILGGNLRRVLRACQPDCERAVQAAMMDDGKGV